MSDPYIQGLAAMAAEGWDGLEAGGRLVTEQARKQAQRMAEDALASGITVLETEPGKRLMARLAQEILFDPPSDLERQPEHAAWHQGRRVGQQEVFWLLVTMLQAARRQQGEEI